MDPTIAIRSQITMFGFGQIILFLVFMGLAKLINKVKKRKVINGALAYLGVGSLLLVVSILRMSFNTEIDSGLKAELTGSIFGSMLLPLGAAIYYTIKFRKQKQDEDKNKL